MGHVRGESRKWWCGRTNSAIPPTDANGLAPGKAPETQLLAMGQGFGLRVVNQRRDYRENKNSASVTNVALRGLRACFPPAHSGPGSPATTRGVLGDELRPPQFLFGRGADDRFFELCI